MKVCTHIFASKFINIGRMKIVAFCINMILDFIFKKKQDKYHLELSLRVLTIYHCSCVSMMHVKMTIRK